MKKSGLLLVVIACFVGVFAALRVDRWLQQRGDLGILGSDTPDASLFHVVDQPSTLPTPVDFRVAAKKVMPSVVSIDRYSRVARGFFDTEGTVAETGQGSGVILSKDGLIVTNNHVVQDAVQVKVRLPDKRTFVAKVLGKDARSDLAVIKIEASNLVPIEIGDSNSIAVGEWVLAVGNPLGFDNTVSVGVVSSLNRDLPVGTSGLVNAIQTDAAINPGNSGGALSDSQGRLIGINSAIASPNGGGVGIGFAIPVDRVKTVVSDIVKLGYARYAGLGVSFNPQYDGALGDSDMRDQLAQATGSTDIPQTGIIVLQSSGAAQESGIRQYDVIEAIDGQPIETSFELNKALINRKPGEAVNVKYWDRGQDKTAKVVLQEIHS